MTEAISCERRTKPLCEENAAPPHCECGCSDADPGKIVGWCSHCDQVYATYTTEREDRHFANHSPAAPETLKETARARLTNLGI